MKLYYHKTSGGAEYLTDRWTRNPDGSKEGVFKNAKYVVRTVFYWFNERTGNKSSFTAKNEAEFFHKLMLRRMGA